MVSMNPNGEPARSRVASALDALASVKFAVTVVVLIAVACVAGTLLPQGADVGKYLQKNPAAAGRMEWLGRAGLTDVFSAWWFLTLLSVLAASVATCSTRRFATVRRTTGYARGRAFGSMLTHISILLILVGGVVRGVWGEKGYLEFREGQTRAQFEMGHGSKPLPFALHLVDFDVETYDQPGQSKEDRCDHLVVQWPERQLTLQLATTVDLEQVVAPPGENPTEENSFRVKVLRYVPDFVVDMATREITSRSAAPNNPAILVEVVGLNYSNHRWLFAKFPDFGMHTADGHNAPASPLQMVYQNHASNGSAAAARAPIKSFKSTLQVVEGEQVVQTRLVEVNSPFAYKGYRFYQSGYDPRDPTWTSLQVVKDPGVPLVYAGFTLMIGGLFIVFYLNPWIEERRGQA